MGAGDAERSLMQANKELEARYMEELAAAERKMAELERRHKREVEEQLEEAAEALRQVRNSPVKEPCYTQSAP